jgi:hypothetical protein
MDLIYEIENALPKEICDIIIDRYKKDPRKEQSKVGSDGIVKENVRKSTVLPFSDVNGWKDVDNIICDVIGRGLNKYIDHVKHVLTKNGTDDNNVIKDSIYMYLKELTDEGYFIQEYKMGGFYNWHIDTMHKRVKPRAVSFVLYLNTLEPDEGGCTEFAFGNSVKPEAGKLLIFPSDWTYVHRSAVVKKPVSKYTIGTWAV